jgi:hypothetical protein
VLGSRVIRIRTITGGRGGGVCAILGGIRTNADKVGSPEVGR